MDKNTVEQIIRKKFLPIVEEVKRIIPGRNFVIAGGAVLDAVLSELDGRPFKPYDIDVFVPASGETRAVKRSTDINDYMGDHPVYKVISSEQNGIFNIIKIEILSQRRLMEEEDTLKLIIDGFDINCIMAGINNNGHVYTTDEFIEFLTTRKIKIVNFYTPFHSAVRLLNKRDRYGFEFDFQNEIRLAKIFAAMSTSLPVTNKFLKEAKTYELYARYKTLLDKHFMISKFINIDGKRTILQAFPKDTPNLLKGIYLHPVGTDMKKLFANARTIMEDSTKRNYLIFLLSSQQSKNIIRTFIKNPDFVDVNPIKYERAIRHLAEVADKIELKTKLSHYLEIAKQSYKQMELEENIVSFNQMIQENVEPDKALHAVLKKYLEPACEPTDLSDFPYREFVRELTTVKDIENTGLQMNNCLRARAREYYGYISKGDKLFVIEKNEMRSVVHLQKITDRSGEIYTIYEHRAHNNQNPPIEHLRIAMHLALYLTEKLFCAEATASA